MYDKEKNPKLQNITEKEIEEKRKHFQKIIDLTYTKIFNNNSIDTLSKSITEAVLLGVGKNLNYIDSIQSNEAQQLFETLKNDPLFSTESLKEGLSQKGKVTNRINRAIQIFSGN
jgi:hypothetical protein